ncbi:drug/metabolite transporter (DMT)-like permease [Amorphus suaedae]
MRTLDDHGALSGAAGDANDRDPAPLAALAVASLPRALPEIAVPPLNAMKGIGLKVLSAFLFCAMLALVKIVGERVPVGQILFARNFFGLIPVVVMVVYLGSLRGILRTRRPFGHMKRAIVGTASMALWFAALQRLALPDATAITYASPLIMVAFAAFFLGEKVRIYRWSAVGVGFVGVIVMLTPQFASGFDIGGSVEATGAAMALTSAVFMALASVFVRELTATEQTGTIVIYFFATASVLSLITAPFGWVMPTPLEAALLVGIGLLGGIAQIFMTQAYRHAEASTIAPFEYTTMLWTVLLGVFVFDEVPQTEVIAGSVVVVGAGLYVIYRERRLGLVRTDHAATTPARG